MEFCSNCGTRLIYKFKRKARLYCPKCGNNSGSLGIQSLKEKSINKKHLDSGIAVVDRKTKKLRTLPRVTASCHKCGGTKAETWSVTLGSDDNSQTTFYRCVSCGYTWRETD